MHSRMPAEAACGPTCRRRKLWSVRITRRRVIGLVMSYPVHGPAGSADAYLKNLEEPSDVLRRALIVWPASCLLVQHAGMMFCSLQSPYTGILSNITETRLRDSCLEGHRSWSSPETPSILGIWKQAQRVQVTNIKGLWPQIALRVWTSSIGYLEHGNRINGVLLVPVSNTQGGRTFMLQATQT